MKLLIFFTLLVALFLVKKEGKELLLYCRLNREGSASLVATSVKEEKKRYFVMGTLEGRVKEIILKGPFPNSYIALADAQKYRLPQEITLWYNSKNPEIMALTKTFPKKSVLYFAIVAGLSCYGFYIKKRYS